MKRGGIDVLALGLAGLLFTVCGTRAGAQPFGAYFSLTGNPTHGFIEIPHNAALNPTTAVTIEAWVSLRDANGAGACSSIIGKNYHQAWWVGVCGTSLRAYFRGDGSAKTGGTVPANVWTHIAVVYDGVTQKHYINGELAQQFAVSGSPTTSTSPVRIASDVSWQFTPQGAIDEVRLWNVARTQAQIRANINVAITSAQPGLVALWALDANAADVFGPHDGALGGAGRGFLTLAVGPCTPSPTVLCLSGRFATRIFWRTNPAPGSPVDGSGQVAGCGTADSGLFWFFSAVNWEVLVKSVNGCGLNSRYWIFSAATTNVFYRMEVYDATHGVQKIFFNYPGPPAPAVTDTSAFATCP